MPAFRPCDRCTRPTCCEDVRSLPLCWWCYKHELDTQETVVPAAYPQPAALVDRVPQPPVRRPGLSPAQFRAQLRARPASLPPALKPSPETAVRYCPEIGCHGLLRNGVCTDCGLPAARAARRDA